MVLSAISKKGWAKPDSTVTLACHAVSAFSPRQVRDAPPAQRPPRSDRDCPLDTAGDRCLWHVAGTAGENDDRSHVPATAPSSVGGYGPSSVTSPRGQEPGRLAQPGGGT
jgi:hypothetical protein